MARRLALIIGNSIYQDKTLVRLKTPDADVGVLHDLLKHPDVGGFNEVKLLINATSTTIRMAITEFFSNKVRNDLLLLYFSGHGVLDDRGRLYLAVKDTDCNYLRANAISAVFIADEMDNSRSQRQVLILDCCHSGAFTRGTKGVTGASVGTAIAFEGSGYGRVVLTATDATQYAWEGDKIIGEAQTSLFTHYLVEGLQTAEADINNDGQITVDEIYDYVYEKIVKLTPQQTPGKWSYKEQGEIVLAKGKRIDAVKRVPLQKAVMPRSIGSYSGLHPVQFAISSFIIVLLLGSFFVNYCSATATLSGVLFVPTVLLAFKFAREIWKSVPRQWLVMVPTALVILYWLIAAQNDIQSSLLNNILSFPLWPVLLNQPCVGHALLLSVLTFFAGLATLFLVYWGVRNMLRYLRKR